MSLYLNRADEAIASCDLNQLKPRFDARDWFDELRRISPSTPWYITYQPRLYFFPTIKPDRVLTASTVCEDEWRTFYLDVSGGNHRAIEVNHIPDHLPTILTAALIHDRNEKSRTISDLRLENEILRGQLAIARHEERQQSFTHVSVSWSTIFALVFLGFSLFWHSANALTTTSTTDSIDPYGMLKLNIWLEKFVQEAKSVIHTHHTTMVNTIQQSPTWVMAQTLLPNLWTITVVTLSLISVYKSQYKVVSILFLCAATMSGGDWIFLSTASYQTYVSALTQVASVAISYLDPLGAICFSAIVMFITFLASMCFPTPVFIQHSRAASVNTVVLISSLVLRTLKLPSLPIAIALACVRAYQAVITTSGSTIEIRSDDGKVVSKETLRPGILFRFKQALSKGFRQIRSTMPPLVRVNPTAVVRIETPDGIGTGFLCANYIVTAGHVMGPHKVGSICVGQAKYQTQIVRHVDGKDIALLKIPQQIQNYPRLKIAQKIETEWVCVYSPDADGAIVQSVVPGHQVDDCIDYAIPTRDGMSGAPLVNPDGRVMGVHLTNTGYTGGAQIITLADVTDPPKTNPNEDKLIKEIEDLKRQLAKCSQSSTNDQEIINLIRAALGREMQILRHEINRELGFVQAKGKTKKGRGKMKLNGAKPRKQRGPIFTEEEYNRLLEEGLTPDEIRDMVERIYEKEAAGYPEWDPFDDGYDPDDDWVFESEINFGQKQVKVPSFNQYLDRDYDAKGVEDMIRSLTVADVEALGPIYHILASSIGTPICSSVLCYADRYAASSGLSPPSFGIRFTQRRVPSKNGQRAQRQRAQKSTN
ncbi:ORF1a [White-tailed deer astrovirus]|nr:ORF1a [White-tailed deer astrovirus]